MLSTALSNGTRVRLLHDVDRYPHFIAPAGATGTVVVGHWPDMIAVRMDEHIPGCEDWDNEVIWSDGDENIADDVEVIS